MKMRRTMVVLALVALAVASVPAVAGAEKPAPPKMRPALVVVDVQNAWLPAMDPKDVKVAIEHINWAIKLFRDNGFPVIRVYHTDPKEGPLPGSEGFAFPKNVAVTDADAMVVKNYSSAFKKTDLDKVLKEKGVNTVFLVGLSAVGCVMATYYGADDLDYRPLMVKHALISHDAALTKSVYDICANISPAALRLLIETAKAQ
ncbi:MAG: isochorismatase family protein [Thermoanaerobaculaceae bacterium]|nr:isochorismatase family protein [Thermoanaerobaculaceae bacterium]